MKKYSSYILFLLITFLVAVININGFGPLDSLQQSIDDFLCRMTSSEDANPNLVMIKIDGATQDKYGSWPWNHDLTADLLAAVASGEPKVITLDFMLNEDGFQDSAGYTDILAGQLSWIENLVVPYDIALSSFRDNTTDNPIHLFDYSIEVDNKLGLMDENVTPQVRKVFLPPEKLLEHNPYLGFEYTMPDEDRIVRHHELLINYKGFYYPSASLIASALYLDVAPDMIKVVEGESISLGSKRTIEIGDKSQFYINFPSVNRYRTISASAILEEGFNFNTLKDKMVIIAIDDFRNNPSYSTNVNDDVNKADIKAAVMNNIITDNMLKVNNNFASFNLIILFLIGGLCAFIMPGVAKMYRFVILGGALFLLMNINYFMFSTFHLITETVYFGLALILFMLASPLLESEFIQKTLEKSEEDDIVPIKKKNRREENRNVIETPQKPVPVSELRDRPDDSQNLATKMSVAGTEDEEDADSKDSSESFPYDHQSIDIDKSEDIEEAASTRHVDEIEDDDDSLIIETIPSAKDDYESAYAESDKNSASDSNQLFNTDQSKIKILGRYEVTGTLGKGAMGYVYKGVDPAINRPVALKTIRLDFVNDQAEMEELKERLFREAQAAGKLSHPNIVTIYDVGSEGHLQYIAMEYLEGQTLEEMIKKKTKFNYKIISNIIIQICRALDYAHDKGIVHRDIKPANIMVLPNFSVKLMDYGIARVDSNSMTKTGVAMGTPNYISPEQLKGLNVDRRADIFSLGVVIYELLVGRRPFRGENITSLIYAITNSDPETPSNINPQIPLLFDRVVDKALKKQPEERYQKAGELIHDLSDFVESFV